MAGKNIFISVDMEGIAGVFTSEQVTRGTRTYPEACRLMTLEANAAVEGAYEGGAAAVVVSDSHGEMDNLLADRLDRRATLVQGSPKWPWGMMTGLSADVDGVVMIGYHARAGTASALMDHTYATEILDIRLNGQSVGEIGVNTALSASLGVPVLAVCGDDAACLEAAEAVPQARTVQVKRGVGRYVASSLSPACARTAVRDAVRLAVSADSYPAPSPLAGPVAVEVDVARSVLADLFSLVPGCERTHARGARFEADSFLDAYSCLMTWCQLIKSL
jgi:D-amino peptidase